MLNSKLPYDYCFKDKKNVVFNIYSVMNLIFSKKDIVS